MADTHKYPGNHNLDEWTAITLYADSIIAEAGIRNDTAEIAADFKHRMALDCDVITVDGEKKFISKTTHQPMLMYALTTFREKAPHFWHMEAPPDLAEQAIIHGNITALGQLVNAIGKDAAEKEAQKRGTSLAGLYKGKLGSEPGSNVVKMQPRSTNPWTAESWSLEKQRSITANMGNAQAASIAASAVVNGVQGYIGQTRPGARRLIPRGA